MSRASRASAEVSTEKLCGSPEPLFGNKGDRGHMGGGSVGQCPRVTTGRGH